MAGENQIIGFTKWLLKWLSILLLGIVLLSLGIWGMICVYQYWTHDRHLKNIEVQIFNGSEFLIDDEKVSGPWQKYQDKSINSSNEEVAVENEEAIADNQLGDLISKKICKDDMPIYISYKNNSSKVIEFIKLDFTAHLPDRSSNILNWDAQLESDLVVPPGKTAMYCAELPVKEEYQGHDSLNKAIYGSKVVNVRFQEK